MRPEIVWNIFKKEILDIARDKRALVISVLIPLLLFPAAFFAMNINLKKTAGSLDAGIPAYVNVRDDAIRRYLLSGGRIVSVESADPAADLAVGKIAAVIEDDMPETGTGKTVGITADNTSQYSSAACDIIHGYITGAAAGPGEKRNAAEVTVVRRTLADAKTGSGTLMLQMLIPMLIFIFSATAPMAVSADLFAGERERGTLEHLLSLPVSGAEVIAGKYMAALCAGITGVVSFMAGTALSYLVSPGVFGAESMSITITPSAVLWVPLFAVLIIMTFTAAEFVISIFSGSAKEAQILFIPLVIIAMACGHSVAMIDVKRISAAYRYIPLVSSGLALKEFMAGIFSYSFMALSAVWCIFITAVLLMAARWMLGREKFIFRG